MKNLKLVKTKAGNDYYKRNSWKIVDWQDDKLSKEELQKWGEDIKDSKILWLNCVSSG